MGADIYARGTRWWWRWRPSRHRFAKRPIIVRISLRTGCRATARRHSVQLEAALDGVFTMKPFLIGRDGLEKVYKKIAEETLDRIVGDRLCLISPHHDRISMAHARMCALVSENGSMPSKRRALQMMDGTELNPQEILDVLNTIDVYANHPLVTDGKLDLLLREINVPVTSENIERARTVGIAALIQACRDATADAHSGRSIDIGLPLPPALTLFSPPAQPEIATPHEAEDRAEVRPGLKLIDPQPNALDAKFSEVAKAVINRKLEDGLWDGKRAAEAGASVSLFIGANGDLPFSSVRQHHLFAWVGLMNALPKRYNHFMVKGQGGFPAALALAQSIKDAVPKEATEAEKKKLLAPIGLHSATRNKHICWLKIVVEGAAAAGYGNLGLDFKSFRHGAKEMKKTDTRKKHEKRPNWTVEAFAKLMSGPVYDGCYNLDRRFKPGKLVFHDGIYWSPLLVLNVCGRPSEGAGVETDDIFEDAPIPYIYIRPNSLRGLKVDEGERKVPIHPKLIELGFIDYVRAIRTAGHKALFPEFVHPAGKLDFAWMMRRNAIDPAKELHFPDGTGLASFGKEPDGHSLRGTGRTALRDAGVEEPMRNYVSGHTQGTVGVEIYETPPPLELVRKAIAALNPFFAHLTPKPLTLRPKERMVFGAKAGRPRKVE